MLSIPSSQLAYSIFINSMCEGIIPLWYDDEGWPVCYATEREAQLEIVDDLQERIRQFIAGEREFDDALTTEEFVLPVEVWPDGSISTRCGVTFGRRT